MFYTGIKNINSKYDHSCKYVDVLFSSTCKVSVCIKNGKINGEDTRVGMIWATSQKNRLLDMRDQKRL